MTNIIRTQAVLITREAFAAYGELIAPIMDMSKEHEAKQFDVTLDLSQGQPRFYVMGLDPTGLSFSAITRHRRTTQCLGSTQNLPWYMALAEPKGLDDDTATPDPETIKVFYIPGHFGIKLHKGTWHAGPLFTAPSKHMFYNLELKDTNVADFHSENFTKGTSYEFDPHEEDKVNLKA